MQHRVKVAVCQPWLYICDLDMAQPFSVVVFHCRHMFHKECLPSSGTVGGISEFALYNLILFFVFFSFDVSSFVFSYSPDSWAAVL